MATWRSVITDALGELGVLAAGETAQAEDTTLGLKALNRLFDNWAAERLFIHYGTRSTWSIVASTNEYTVGSGGDIDIARPVFIDAIKMLDSNDQETHVGKLTERQYRDIVNKELTSTVATNYYYNPTYPLGTLTLFPIPTDSTYTGVLYAPTAVSQASSLTATVSLPPGYEDMIVTNLALRLASSYGVRVDPLLVRQAEKTKAIVQRANSRQDDMVFESGACVAPRMLYNIETDQ
jgi:hypothetical protein